MKWLETFLLVVGIIGTIFLVAGLYKPWIMLWWEAKQNRRKVLTLYGSIVLVSFLIYSTLRLART
jgi:hypothetical protein